MKQTPSSHYPVDSKRGKKSPATHHVRKEKVHPLHPTRKKIKRREGGNKITCTKTIIHKAIFIRRMRCPDSNKENDERYNPGGKRYYALHRPPQHNTQKTAAPPLETRNNSHCRPSDPTPHETTPHLVSETSPQADATKTYQS